MGNLMRFNFPGPVDLDAVENDMALALLVAEFLYGKPRVRLEAGYYVSSSDGSFVVQVSGPAGETAAQVFAGFCAIRFGEEGYHVDPLSRDKGDNNNPRDLAETLSGRKPGENR